MQTKLRIPQAFLVVLLIGGVAGAVQAYRHMQTPQPAVYIGVMIDNHEDARAYQRGLEKAPLVQEYLVEGFITRFLAVFDADDMPASIGPVRSARPYVVEGSSPLLQAIFHVGGSPEALDRLQKKSAPESFNALYGYDDSFEYDKDAPAPHNRFLTQESAVKLLSGSTKTLTPSLLPFTYGPLVPGQTATGISIVYHNPVHDISYSYDARTKTYAKTSDGELRPPSPKNIVILEADTVVVGPFGRLGIDLQGKGKAVLLRDGTVQEGTWSKTGADVFFVFQDVAGEPFSFRKGQIWMIVLDSLDRVSWE